MRKVHLKGNLAELVKGVNILSSAVASTLGPEGRNVMIDSPTGTPHVTKDGVTVAKSIYVRNRVQNMAIQLVKQAALETMREAGDGTTTSTILAAAIVNGAAPYIQSNSVNPIRMRKGMYKAVEDITTRLKAKSKPCRDLDSLFKVAKVSANGDADIAKIVSEVKMDVGEYGNVVYRPSNGSATEVNYFKGMQLDSGMLTEQLKKGQSKTVLNNPYVFVLNYEVLMNNDIYMLMHQFLNNANYIGKDVLIICDNMDGEALAMVHKNAHQCNLAVVRTPYSINREKYLIDIAAFTGAVIVNESAGIKLKDVNFTHAGTVDKVVIQDRETILIGPSQDVTERVNLIKEELESAKPKTPEYDDLKRRLASISGAIAVISIGANTEAQLNELFDIYDDVINAVNSAYEEGVVVGGGNTLQTIAHELRASNKLDSLSEDEFAGYAVVVDAIEEPLFNIFKNHGIEKEKISVSRGQAVYSVNGEIILVDEDECPIYDPTKVLRFAIANAVSAASTILTTSCIVEFDEEYVEMQNKAALNIR
jgi:chaperonin GroEL